MGLYQFNETSYSYMVKEENDETSVKQGQSYHYTLVSLNRREHLIQVGVKVAKTAHEDRDGDETTQTIVSLYDVVR